MKKQPINDFIKSKKELENKYKGYTFEASMPFNLWGGSNCPKCDGKLFNTILHICPFGKD